MAETKTKMEKFMAILGEKATELKQLFAEGSLDFYYVSLVTDVVCCDVVPDVLVPVSVNKVVSVAAVVPTPVPQPTYLGCVAAPPLR